MQQIRIQRPDIEVLLRTEFVRIEVYAAETGMQVGYFAPFESSVPAGEGPFERIELDAAARRECGCLHNIAELWTADGKTALGFFVSETDDERRGYRDFERRFTDEDFERGRATTTDGKPLPEVWNWIHGNIGPAAAAD